MIKLLDFHDLYLGRRLSEGEILDEKLDRIEEKINEIIVSINQRARD